MERLTDRELAELIRQAEQEKQKMPVTRRQKKEARKRFKKMRMGLRREEKRAKGLTRSAIDRAYTV